MDAPGWFVWIFLSLAVLQALSLVPLIHRLRRSDPSVRFAACLDLLDAVGSLLLLGGLFLGLAVAESWSWLTFSGLALLTAVYAVKGVHWVRARRRPTA